MFCSMEAYWRAVDYMNSRQSSEDAVYESLPDNELTKAFKEEIQKTRRMIQCEFTCSDNVHTDNK